MRATEDEVDDAGVVILLREVLLADDDGEGGDQRRDNAGGGDGGHEVGAEVVGVGADAGGQSLSEQGSAGDVGSLVDGAAHVERAHAADGQAEDDRAGGLEALQEAHHAGVDGSHGAGDPEHDEAGDEGREQRIQEDRLEAVEVLGKPREKLLESEDHVACEEAADDAAEEAEADARATGVDEAGRGIDGEALDGDHACDEARYESGTLADGLSDVGGEDGHHEVHGDAADDLEHGRERVVVSGGRIVGVDAPEERDGREDAAGDHEDEHVADTVHQVLVDDVADGLLLEAAVVRRGVDDRVGHRSLRLGGEGLVDQAIRVLDGGGDADADQGLASEALRLHVLVGSDDDGLGSLDLCRGHLVLDADLTVSLDLDGETTSLGGLFEGLLGHEGVRNACGTTGCSNEVVLSHLTLLSCWVPTGTCLSTAGFASRPLYGVIPAAPPQRAPRTSTILSSMKSCRNG